MELWEISLTPLSFKKVLEIKDLIFIFCNFEILVGILSNV